MSTTPPIVIIQYLNGTPPINPGDDPWLVLVVAGISAHGLPILLEDFFPPMGSPLGMQLRLQIKL